MYQWSWQSDDVVEHLNDCKLTLDTFKTPTVLIISSYILLIFTWTLVICAFVQVVKVVNILNRLIMLPSKSLFSVLVYMCMFSDPISTHFS